MQRFTDRYLQSLQPEETRYDRREANGFAIRVSPTGVKTFTFIYTLEGKKRRITLGNYPAMTLQNARAQFNELRELVDRGIDPATWRADQEAAAKKAQEMELREPTVSFLVEEYLEKWAKPRKRSWAEDMRILNKDVIPRWGERKAKDVTRREVIALLDEIVNRGGPIMANSTLAVIRKMYNFAIQRDIVETSPCHKLPPPAPPVARKRKLAFNEIRIVFNKLPEAKMIEKTRLVLLFLLVTAQRKVEVVGARWEEFNLEEGIWIIPSERVKNKTEHLVPLSAQAKQLLAKIRVLSGDSPFLFPSTGKSGYLGVTSIDHAVLKNIELFGIKPWTPHDLRRTVTTHMSGLGVSRLISSKVLNHSDKKLIAIYDIYDYEKEKRAALDAWGKRLEEIIGKSIT